MTEELEAVRNADYVLLTTFRKNGTPVGTAVWAVADGEKLYVWTETESWKVKRLRRNPAVTLQPCGLRGKPHGAVVSGTGQVLDAEGTARVRKLINKKYFIIGPLTTFGSKLRRGAAGTIGVEISLDA